MYCVSTVRRQAAVAICVIFALCGCAGGPERLAVPPQLAAAAQIPDMDDVRVWGDAPLPWTLLAPDLPKLKAKYAAKAKAEGRVAVDLLALSGGADDGAFGAGLLVGWGQHGDRPEFALVTGISAGALIAPFAFLGKDYDRELASLFTTYGADKSIRPTSSAGCSAAARSRTTRR